MKKIILCALVVAAAGCIINFSKNKEIIALDCTGSREVDNHSSGPDDKVTMVISSEYYLWQDKNYKITFGSNDEKYSMYFPKSTTGNPFGPNFFKSFFLVDDRDMIFEDERRFTPEDNPSRSEEENRKFWYTMHDYQKVVFDKVSKQMKFVVSHGYIDMKPNSGTYHEKKFSGQCKMVKTD